MDQVLEREEVNLGAANHVLKEKTNEDSNGKRKLASATTSCSILVPGLSSEAHIAGSAADSAENTKVQTPDDQEHTRAW